MAPFFTEIHAYVLWLSWKCLSDTPDRLKHPAYAILLASHAVLASVCTDAIHFAPGLLDAVQSDSAPTLSFFENLPVNTRIRGRIRWAVYLLVLRHPKLPNARPKIYISSATASDDGVTGRMDDYKLGRNLSVGVQQALDQGYRIGHRGLLCWTDRPQPLLRIQIRALFLLLETVFTLVFWALKSRTKDYGMPSLCPWDIRSLAYDGCCTHLSLNEGIAGLKEGLTLEEMNQVEKWRAEKTREDMAQHQGKSTND